MDERRLVAGFAGKRVVVIGEAMLDRYLHGSAERIGREAPVPVVALARREDVPGGAANTAAAVAALGAESMFLSLIGDDAEGEALRDALAARGVGTAHVQVQAGRGTLAKNRVLAAGQILVRFDSGDTTDAAPETEAALCSALAAAIPHADAVMVSDYGYGVLTARARATLAGLLAQHPIPVLVDAKDLPAYRDLRPTAIKPNYAEARALLHLAPPADGDRAAQITGHADSLLAQTGARIAVVTLDRDGALVLTRDGPPCHVPAATTLRAETRTTGAGDTFGAVFTLTLAAGGDATAAARIASAAAGVVVAKEGTATCTLAELCQVLDTGNAPGAASAAGETGVVDLATLLPILAARRAAGARIVFTNGCFDILHRGHTGLLAAARARGDLLVVGVNTDASVRRLKGPSRPVNVLAERMAVLAALKSVDYVVPFAAGEDTPHHLIAAIRPEIFVKGGDYTRETLPEAALVESLGGTVAIIPYLPDHSTTRIIAHATAAVTVG